MGGYPFDKTYRFPSLPGGQDSYLKLECPPQGFVSCLVVHQVDGTAGGFTATLYNSMLAVPGGSVATDDGGEGPLDPSVYQRLSVTAAASARTASYAGEAVPYVNQDHHPLGRGRYLVLKVRPADAGTFHVGLAGANPMTA